MKIDRKQLALFCQNATDAQLNNIYRDEVDRAKRHGEDSEVGAAAVAFAEEAERELKNRGIWMLQH